ncbi:MAG: 5-deoxy-glucuronate isomerase [Brevinema sp.]
MPEHILPYDNNNIPIVDNHSCTPDIFFNDVKLKKGEIFKHHTDVYETVCVVVHGTVDFTVKGQKFSDIGKRKSLFEGLPEGVYVPLNAETEIECLSETAEILIGGGIYEEELEPFAILQEDIDKVQYGSDDTKTHRKIYHILGQKNKDRAGRLLVSELFTVGAGGWSGFPPHKHDEDRKDKNGTVIETNFPEGYHFRFNPENGFGAQFLYATENDFGPVAHIKNGSTILIDKGYHPSVVAPGYEMYYFTILVGNTTDSLIQYFEEQHSYQLKTIPGIMDMVNKFK